MHPDAKLCFCFHVSKRKVTNFILRERPRRPSQISECWGAGTGCGWCIPFLEKLHAEIVGGDAEHNARLLADDDRATPDEGPLPKIDLEMDIDEYAKRRKEYRRAVADGERGRNRFGGSGESESDGKSDDDFEPF